jgi:hypothetical protein
LTVDEFALGLVNVIANDTDPDGDYPLTLVAVDDPNGVAFLASSTQIGWTGTFAGLYTVHYTVRDARGATSTGTLQVTVNGCGLNVCQ